MSFSLVLSLLIVGFLLYNRWIRHTWQDGAPYEGMSPDVVGRVMKIARAGPKDVFYDLGSGDGRVVIAAAMRGAKAYGIEIDKLRVLYSKMWIKLLRLKNAKIIHKDIQNTDLSKATVVCLYLTQEANDKLQKKLKKELKKGTRVVSLGFEFKDWRPEKIDPRGAIYGPIYLYRI